MAGMKTIVVLGGGSAGFTAARIAWETGARVLFFMGDNADHASLCINAGCMPSKALFEPIDAMHHAKQHGWLEVKPKQPNEYLGQVVRWKDHETLRRWREDPEHRAAQENGGRLWYSWYEMEIADVVRTSRFDRGEIPVRAAGGVE